MLCSSLLMHTGPLIWQAAIERDSVSFFPRRFLVCTAFAWMCSGDIGMRDLMRWFVG